MAGSSQNFKTHRRFIPLFHFFALPVLLLNVVAQIMVLNKYRSPYKAWLVLVAVALLIVAFVARAMSTKVQDRVIRLEERLRLTTLLPEDLRGRIDELTPGQLVGLRFAADAEVAGLAQRCFAGDLTKGEQIKREIKNWRADTLRA